MVETREPFGLEIGPNPSVPTRSPGASVRTVAWKRPEKLLPAWQRPLPWVWFLLIVGAVLAAAVWMA